jgi:beta-lactamase regulating signal transducer with metallopeptidase domain
MDILFTVAAKATLILTVALLIGRWLPDERVELRVNLWRSTVLAVLLLGPFSMWLPSWQLPIVPAADPLSSTAIVPVAAVVPMAEPDALAMAMAMAMAMPAGWLSSGFVALWAAGVLLALLGLVRALAGLMTWTRRSRSALQPSFSGVVDRLTQKLKLSSAPRVAWSGDADAPLSWGLARGQVLLPDDWQQAPRTMIHDALAHEFSHLRRRDWLWLIIARLGAGLLWWNPLMHRVVRHLCDDTELACDELAIEVSESPASYARTLIAASQMQMSQRPLSAALAMAESSCLRRRIQAVMTDPSRRFQMTQPHKSLFHTLVLVLLMPMAACQISRAQTSDPAPAAAPAKATRSAPAVAGAAYPSRSASPAPALAYGEAPASRPAAPASPSPASAPATPDQPTTAPSPPDPASPPDPMIVAPRVPRAPNAPHRPVAEAAILAEAKAVERQAREQRREAERAKRAAERAQLAAERELARAAERQGREERDAVRHKEREETREIARQERALAREERQQLALERDQLERQRAELEVMQAKLSAEREALERQRQALESVGDDNR